MPHDERPWVAEPTLVRVAGLHGPPVLLAENDDQAGEQACREAALAHNARLVQMRRGWSALRDTESEGECWYAADSRGRGIDCSTIRGTKSYPLHAEPDAALVAADEWYKQNVDK